MRYENRFLEKLHTAAVLGLVCRSPIHYFIYVRIALSLVIMPLAYMFALGLTGYWMWVNPWFWSKIAAIISFAVILIAVPILWVYHMDSSRSFMETSVFPRIDEVEITVDDVIYYYQKYYRPKIESKIKKLQKQRKRAKNKTIARSIDALIQQHLNYIDDFPYYFENMVEITSKEGYYQEENLKIYHASPAQWTKLDIQKLRQKQTTVEMKRTSDTVI